MGHARVYLPGAVEPTSNCVSGIVVFRLKPQHPAAGHHSVLRYGARRRDLAVFEVLLSLERTLTEKVLPSGLSIDKHGLARIPQLGGCLGHEHQPDQDAVSVMRHGHGTNAHLALDHEGINRSALREGVDPLQELSTNGTMATKGLPEINGTTSRKHRIGRAISPPQLPCEIEREDIH